MFTESLPEGVFTLQREFIRAMGGKLDFVWAAEKLIAEEVNELEVAYNAKEISDENLANIFKESADVIYVVAYFYNVLPTYGPELISEQKNKKISKILESAADIISKVSQKLQIPLPMLVTAFELVHKSNMSKLDDNGKPLRREDGKILKGPNYQPPDMMPLVQEYKQFQIQRSAR